MSLTLHGFASKLLSDPQAMAAYEFDPEGELAAAGLQDITPQDVQEIIPLVTEYSSTGGYLADETDENDGYLGGELSTPHGTFVAGNSVDLTGTVPSGHLGATTPDGDFGVGYGQDGIAAGGTVITGDDGFVVGGTLDPVGMSGHLGVVTNDGSFGIDVSRDGLDIGGDAMFSRFNDLGDSLDSDALDLAGGASSIASLLTSGASLGPTALLDDNLLQGGLGGLPVDTGRLPVDVPQVLLQAPQLPDTGVLDTSQVPLDAPQLSTGGELPAGLELPVQLPQLPVELPALPVELPMQLPELPVADTPAADVLHSTGMSDLASGGAVSDSPVGHLLSGPVDGLGSTGDLLPLDQHLSL